MKCINKMGAKLLLPVIASIFWGSAPALADSPSFTYVGVEYIASGDFEISDGTLSASVDTDGYALNASVELGIFFLQASRLEIESEELFNASIEDNISTLAAGITFELPQTQLYGLIRARHDDVTGRVGNISEQVDGGVIGAEVGARVNLTDRFEINANIGVPSTDEGTSYGIGAQFFVTDHIGITLNANTLELEEGDIQAKFDTTSIGVRFTF